MKKGNTSGNITSHSTKKEKRNLSLEIIYKLNENPHLTATKLCYFLDLNYKKYKGYVNKVKSIWKKTQNRYDLERVSNSSTFVGSHNNYYCGLVVGGLDRVKVLSVGWVESKNRNHKLLFKHVLGNIAWFTTDRLRIYVRGEAKLGFAKKMVADAFLGSGLLSDDEFLVVAESISLESQHRVYKKRDGEVCVFDLMSHGVKMYEDKSHPDRVEAEVSLTDTMKKLYDLTFNQYQYELRLGLLRMKKVKPVYVR